MKVEVRTSDDITIIDCAGEADLNAAWQLRDILVNALHGGAPGVLVNLAEVTYMDSSGVAALVEGLQASRGTRTRFALCGLKTSTRSVLAMARLDKVFVIFDDEHQALDRIWDIEPFRGL